MTSRPKLASITEEVLSSIQVAGAAGSPVLLGVFPVQVAVPVPQNEDVVGRIWFERAGVMDGKISREQISFGRIDGRLYVTDKRSHNGTYVNGVRIDPETPTPLDDGALLRIGHTIFIYREALAGSLTPEPPQGSLVGPWTLEGLRRALFARTYREGLNVLLEGPAGSGKKLLAKEIAKHFGRGAKIVHVNVATIPRDSFEGNLFGWERQVFTGSFGAYPGMLRSAAGGTVFLEGIETLPAELLPKLLRFLEKRQIQPVGARELPPPIDCLVIASTNHNVLDLLASDGSRRDLFGRFQLRFSLSPLAQRREDLFALVAARWELLHGKLDMQATRVDVEAIERLMLHDWPENVRELFRFVDGFDRNAGIKRSTVERMFGADGEAAASRDAASRHGAASRQRP